MTVMMPNASDAKRAVLEKLEAMLLGDHIKM